MNETVQILLEIVVLILRINFAICEAVFRLIWPVPKKSVKGEIVLITGAGHGIGKELALQYADLDAIVVCWDINEKTNNNTVLEIKKMNKIAYGYSCDVRNRTDVMATAEKVKREVGDVTILINNAGILLSRSLLTHNEEDIRKTFDVNVMSQFWTIQAFLPSMIEKNFGHVVALSSGVALSPFGNLVPYSSSKYAVRGLMTGLRDELRSNKQNQIKLTTVFPFIVTTGLSKYHVVRFCNAMPEVHPKAAATSIINAQRRNVVEKSIPNTILAINKTVMLLPIKAHQLLRDFMGIYFKSDK